MISRWFGFLVVAVLLLLPSLVFGFELSPTRAVLSAEAGQTVEFELRIKNISNEKKDYIGEAWSFYQEGSGVRYEQNLPTQISAGPVGGRLSLLPQQEGILKFFIQSSATTKAGEYHLALFAKESSTVDGASSLQKMIGSLVFFYVAGTVKEEVGLDNLRVHQSNKGLKIFFDLKNTGDILAAPIISGRIFSDTVFLSDFEEKIRHEQVYFGVEKLLAGSEAQVVVETQIPWRFWGRRFFYEIDITTASQLFSKKVFGQVRFFPFAHLLSAGAVLVFLLFGVVFYRKVKSKKYG